MTGLELPIRNCQLLVITRGDRCLKNACSEVPGGGFCPLRPVCLGVPGGDLFALRHSLDKTLIPIDLLIQRKKRKKNDTKEGEICLSCLFGGAQPKLDRDSIGKGHSGRILGHLAKRLKVTTRARPATNCLN